MNTHFLKPAQVIKIFSVSKIVYINKEQCLLLPNLYTDAGAGINKCIAGGFGFKGICFVLFQSIHKRRFNVWFSKTASCFCFERILQFIYNLYWRNIG